MVKRLIVAFLTLVIIGLYLCFIILDFSRFYSLDYYAHSMTSALLKRVCVVLAATIVWISGRDGVNSGVGLMKTAFIVICFAEAALFYGRMAPGIGLFVVCQILLCFRNGMGLRQKLGAAAGNKKIRLILFGEFLAAAYIIVIGLSYQIILRYNLLPIVCLYALLISSSLWVGFANYTLELLPRKNSIMVFIGMICFYCCDILVGLDEIMEPSLLWILVNSTIWFFYIPAIVLLALSCYKYDGKRSDRNAKAL